MWRNCLVIEPLTKEKVQKKHQHTKRKSVKAAMPIFLLSHKRKPVRLCSYITCPILSSLSVNNWAMRSCVLFATFACSLLIAAWVTPSGLGLGLRGIYGEKAQSNSLLSFCCVFSCLLLFNQCLEFHDEPFVFLTK
jgi:hypothetical protein